MSDQQNAEPILLKVTTDIALETLADKLPDGKSLTIEELEAIRRNLLDKIRHTDQRVLPFQSDDDFRHRLDTEDHAVYAYLNAEGKPLVFIQTALTKGGAHSLTDLLDQDRPAETNPDSVVFYAIVNVDGIGTGGNLGEKLILNVARELAGEPYSCKDFMTLSPLQDFRRWLDAALESGTANDLFSASERKDLGKSPATILRFLLTRYPDQLEPEAREIVEGVLERLAAHYVIHVSAETDPRRAFDGVTHYHQKNGAVLDGVFAGADPTDKGFAKSYGLMARYRYDLRALEASTVREENQVLYKAGGRAATVAMHALSDAGADEGLRQAHAEILAARQAALDARMAGK